MKPSGDDVTALLHAWTAGDTEARDRLMAVLYQELHRRAAAHLRRERPGHTLQPTALVHEALGISLGISLATAERDWQAARAWLWKELRGERQHDA
jgi:ECF sigma factor